MNHSEFLCVLFSCLREFEIQTPEHCKVPGFATQQHTDIVLLRIVKGCNPHPRVSFSVSFSLPSIQLFIVDVFPSKFIPIEQDEPPLLTDQRKAEKISI